MAVLSFQSADGKVAIKASTAADTATCWRRFSARVGENASRYCDYRSSLAGRLAIALPSQSNSLTDAGEEASTQWNNLPPVFYETAVYNVNIYLSDIEAEPHVVHKLKEVSNLFTAISVGDNKWVLTAPLSFLNEPGIFELSYRYKPVERLSEPPEYVVWLRILHRPHSGGACEDLSHWRQRRFPELCRLVFVVGCESGCFFQPQRLLPLDAFAPD